MNNATPHGEVTVGGKEIPCFQCPPPTANPLALSLSALEFLFPVMYLTINLVDAVSYLFLTPTQVPNALALSLGETERTFQ